MNSNEKNGLKTVKELYNNLSYFDQYGSSVLLLIIVTIALFVLCSYCFVLINIQPIKDDWVNQRCKPSVIPFAGIINKPENTSATDFTKENFDFCTQNIIKGVTGNAVQPLTFITSTIAKVFDAIQQALNSVREMFDKIRLQMRAIAEEIMGRLINSMIPIQQIIIGLKDILSKVQGTMTAGLYTLLGSYYTLSSLMGAIAQLIVTILIALAVMVACFWAVPFTWGLASVNTAIFIAISIPMALILAFMINVMKVNTNLKIPKIKCFDKNTHIEMNDGSIKKIHEIEIGDALQDKNIVTSKVKVITEGSVMYNLNNVIVSDSHYVLCGEKWIQVSQHPEAILLDSYEEPYLFCLNTSSKYIQLNGNIFTDWDELFDSDIQEFRNHLNRKFPHKEFHTSDIHKHFDGGFLGSTEIRLMNGTCKTLSTIDVGDVLQGGERTYGIVEISGMKCHDLGEGIIGSESIVFQANRKGGKKKDRKKEGREKMSVPPKLYHILTDKKTLTIGSTVFLDYNAAIDCFLGK
jgi:hypothetical protein